jgi:S1-C subfamily serine protease
VSSESDLNLILNRKRPGETVTLTVIRERRKVNVPVRLGEG